MRKTKKIVALMLSIVMLFSAVAISASASKISWPLTTLQPFFQNSPITSVFSFNLGSWTLACEVNFTDISNIDLVLQLSRPTFDGTYSRGILLTWVKTDEFTLPLVHLEFFNEPAPFPW